MDKIIELKKRENTLEDKANSIQNIMINVIKNSLFGKSNVVDINERRNK